LSPDSLLKSCSNSGHRNSSDSAAIT
jgi:hypothetical protein